MLRKIYTTEVTSDTLPSDNPLHQRLFKAYVLALSYLNKEDNVLEVGCGEGRGIDLLLPAVSHFMAVDKLKPAIDRLSDKYPQARFLAMNFPPFTGIEDNLFDVVLSFQVIEHIRDDRFFLQEIHRVLKPGGVALLTTPNRKKSLSRNPWHVREYLADELENLTSHFFNEVEIKGIAGNDKVMAYYEQNRMAVERIMRWDVLNLQHRLPGWMLRLPYEILNRINRNRLRNRNHQLADSITHEDYLLTDRADDALDLFVIARKKSA
ncbi:MAG: class I SAM-dependent methyltransferase [Cyclobacteriaceae bacterium]|nr:class I SAM-dependent methyltransferase [Cyclobacteriaceae bacterium]MDW8331279.1 methyltransferase domain-containing protein [Cyclobacteriaceae bacterium]